jgi:CheY-like chemotaxis protein
MQCNQTKLGLYTQFSIAVDVQGFTNPLKKNCNNIDIVLSDIRMPQINGYEIAKKISKLEN